MFDIDSLPDIYETMIDRPAFVYDSLFNVTSLFTRNLTKFCQFFVQRLNYTFEQCEDIFNHTAIDTNQVWRNRIEMIKDDLYVFSAKKKKRFNRSRFLLCY